jgi:zinc transporter ZupT
MSDASSTGVEAERSTPRLPLWVTGVGPLILLALLVATFLRFGPVGVLRQAFPPVEKLTIDRVTLPHPGEMRVHVTNGGPESVTIAQVMVDDANWVHRLDGPRTVARLGSRTVTIPYPWVEGEPHQVALVTSTGLTFVAGVPVATQTPSVDVAYLSTFALLGIYAGVIPVLLGLLWFPFLRGVPRHWMDFFLSLTIGLLVFLGVDALGEALATAARVPDAYQGIGLVVLGVGGTLLAISAFGHFRRKGRATQSRLYVATLIAAAIGVHNLGEGLAIGTAYAGGEIALGTFLVIGFLLHNTTEGLGIVAPLAGERPRLGQLAALGLLAGVPTVLGTWAGGFSYSPVLTTLCFAGGAGAITQVVVELWRLFARQAGPASPAPLSAPLNAIGVLTGLLLMYATGVFVPA